jgi:hypothetical protein
MVMEFFEGKSLYRWLKEDAKKLEENRERIVWEIFG